MAGPVELREAGLFLRGNDADGLSFGVGAESGSAYALPMTDLAITYVADAREVRAQATVDADSLLDRISFAGLHISRVTLDSRYRSRRWEFGMDAEGSLNRRDVELAVSARAPSAGRAPDLEMTLTSKAGIRVGDVAGRHIPGLDKIALTSVTVTSDRLVADFAFGAKKTEGEIAAFQAGSGKAPVLAMTLDRLAFGELIPSAAGSVLDGIDVDDLTVVIVPARGRGAAAGR